MVIFYLLSQLLLMKDYYFNIIDLNYYLVKLWIFYLNISRFKKIEKYFKEKEQISYFNILKSIIGL